MAMKKCPVCGVSVKLENLERHVRNQHPRAQVDLRETLSDSERQEAARAKAAPALTRSGRRLIAIVAIAVAAILILVILNPFGQPVNPGQPAPDFTLPLSTGGTVTLSSYRGTPVFLEIMDLDCEYCVEEARDVLPSLHANYSARVRFLSMTTNWISPADTESRIAAFKTTYGTDWPYAMDDSGNVARTLYRIQGTPSMYILDRSGIIVRTYYGVTAYATLAAALDEALARV